MRRSPFDDDVVALEHGARLVSGELHRDALGDAAPDHVPDGRSAQVVWNSSWAPGGDAGEPSTPL